MVRLLLSLALGGAIFAFVGYQMGLFTTEEPPKNIGEGPSGEQEKPDLGDWLARRSAPPKFDQDDVVKTVRDPVVYSAHMNTTSKLEVSSPVPGKILFVGEEVPEGAAQVAGIAPFVTPQFENAGIPGPKEEVVFIYRRYFGNEIIGDKQMVAKMDPTKVLGEWAVKSGKLTAAKAMESSAKHAANEAHVRFLRADALFRIKVIPEEEWGAARLTKVKFEEEYKTKVEEAKLAAIELDQIKILFKQHDILSGLGTKRARIQKVNRFRGEGVKDEPIVILHDPDRLRAEGLLEAAYKARVKIGDRVRVEPIDERVPLRTLTGHLGEINAVAVTKDADFPRFLSASEDGTVCVWDQWSKKPLRELVHGEPVRSLAVSPPKSKHNLALTGTKDGNVFLWDLSKPGKLPLKEIKKVHRDAVTSVAFSPDGEYFATGGDDAQMYLFNKDGQQLYSFDPEHSPGDAHRGTVTSLHFTEHGTLISASRDNTVRIWNLKEKGPELEGKPITGRTGGVSQLGVSADGSLMLLDRGKDLQVLSAVDGSRIATLKNPVGGLPFETLAQFSPDKSLILTAGAPEGRLQLWRAPDVLNRGHEVVQLVTPERGAVTCAAISPIMHKGADQAMVISGTKDCYVYLWALPDAKEVEGHATVGTVTLVGDDIAAGSRQIQIWVDVPNSDGRFTPGRPVTIVIGQETKETK